jgi:hypothetical protein
MMAMRFGISGKHALSIYQHGWSRKLLVLSASIILPALFLSACSRDDAGHLDTASNTNAGANAGTNKLAVKNVTASKTGTGNVATANATDGDLKTQWSAGGPAPQWIQLDLGQDTPVSKVRLNVSQTPAGETVHEVYGGATPDQMKLMGKLENNTQDNQWLELNFPASNFRYLKIVTVKSPSWVAWREIEVSK